MKIKNIKLTVKDRKDALNEFAGTLAESRKSQPNSHKEISFQNIETLRKFLTEKRLELLHTIKKHNPSSIYELAGIVKRDLKSVNTDIATLKSLNLVSLEKIKKEREKVKPRVHFDRLNVEISI